MHEKSSAPCADIFEDTAFSICYTDAQSLPVSVLKSECNDHIALDIRQDMKPGLLQVNGYVDWSDSQSSEIAAPGGSNAVSTSVGVVPLPS